MPSSKTATAPRRRLGCTEPRVFTPPLRELTPETSAGYSVIEFAEVMLEIDLFPWQKWLLIHALELLEDGSFRFRTVVVFVARQNGKSTLSQVLGLWAIYILGIALVLGTAQDLDTAEAIWDEAVDLAKEVPDLAAEIAHVDKTNGKKALRLARTPEFRHDRKWKVKAANRRAGRGSSGDLILLDELREHTSWDAWGAITHTTMARPNAQVWALSNAGDAASVVARYLRIKAHVVLGNPDGLDVEGVTIEQPPEDEDFDTGEDSMGLFEWSAHPDRDKWDRDGWAEANPSLGYGITERTIASFAGTDPEWTFRTEVLCQWADTALDGPFPTGAWEAGIDPTSAIVGPVTFAVDVSWDRGWTYIAAAGRREDGLPHVEVVERGMGTEWVAKWFTDRAVAGKPVEVVGQTAGAPVSSLLPDLEALTVEDDAGYPVPAVTVVPWGGTDLGIAAGVMYDRVARCLPPPDDVEDPWVPERDGIRHLPQPVLDVAAGVAATRPVGDAWVWDRKRSPVDIAALVAATGAVWRALQPREAEGPSAYEDNDLMIV